MGVFPAGDAAVQALGTALTTLAMDVRELKFRVTAIEEGTPEDPEDPPDPPPNQGNATVTRRVNCGFTGADYTDSSNRAWEDDNYFSGGSTSNQGLGQDFGVADDALFEYERFGNFTYTFTGLPPGSARIILGFAESHATTDAAGERLFDVVVNNVLKLDNYDIFVEAENQQYEAVYETIDTTIGSDGILVLQFVTVVNSACVQNIEVLCYGEVTEPPPDPDPEDPEPPPPPPTGFWYSGGSRNTNVYSATTEWANMRGRPCTLQVVYATRNAGWSAFVSAHATSGQPAAFNDKNLILLLQTSPFPTNIGANYAALVSGAYDSYWRQIGTLLQNRFNAGIRTILSPAWEMNGTYMYWGGGSGPGKYSSPAQYRDGFRRIVTQVRTTYPGCPIAWIQNAHGTPSATGATDAWAFYPGSQYVNYIGIDDYDMYPPSGNSVPNTAFTNRANRPDGILWLAQKLRNERAAGHTHLKFIVGEWGVSSGSGSNGGFDNPGYIENMYNVFNSLFQEGIFFGEYYFADPIGGGNVDSDLIGGHPLSRARYQSLWGI